MVYSVIFPHDDFVRDSLAYFLIQGLLHTFLLGESVTRQTLINTVETQRYEKVKERVTALALMNCGENPLLLAIKVRRFPSHLISVREVAFPVSLKDTANRGKT